MAEDDEVVDEIATLLDQCSPEELANILQAIEGGEDLDTDLNIADITKAVPASAVPAPAAGPPIVPPAGPPPANGHGRRPPPAGVKMTAFGGEAVPDDATVSVGERKKLLEQHSAGVLEEVRRMMPFPTGPVPGDAVDPATMEASLQNGALNLEVLTTILAQRDQEVKELEAHLSDLQTQLQAKDRRIGDLNGEMDNAIREVRHRQLDLEFQQLKLEERVRSNNELEQAHRKLTARVEEANYDSRHAALDVDLARSMPRSARVQGSLPWMLRKNRPWGNDAWNSP